MKLRSTRNGNSKKPIWHPTLSNNIVLENNTPNQVVGLLRTIDADDVDLTYSIIDGDASAFVIEGNQLKAAGQFNFESKNSYAVTVRAIDSNGLYYDDSFSVSITNQIEKPTDISLSNSSITEYNAVNADIGTLSVSKPSSQPVTYTIIGGDTSAFNINGDKLRASASYRYATKNSYSVTVRADSGGEYLDKTFNIGIIDYSFTYNGRIVKTTSTSTGVSGATVRFYTQQGGTLLATATTNSSGYYSVVFELSGSYYVTVTASGYNTWSGTINTGTTSSIGISPASFAVPVTVSLTWNAEPRDLDFYLRGVYPDGNYYTVNYSNKTVTGEAVMGADDTDGYGPETITIQKFNPGTYVFYVSKYTGVGELAQSGAKVTVKIPGRSDYVVNVPTNAGTNTWWVAVFIDGVNGTISSSTSTYSSKPY